MDPKKNNLKTTDNVTNKPGVGGGQILVSLKHITLDKIRNYINRAEIKI